LDSPPKTIAEVCGLSSNNDVGFYYPSYLCNSSISAVLNFFVAVIGRSSKNAGTSYIIL
jgi:hypothetical protein